MKEGSKRNAQIQYHLNTADNCWLDERYANGFGERYDVVGTAFTVSPDGSSLLTAAYDTQKGPSILLYDLKTGQLKEEYLNYDYPMLYRADSKVTSQVPLIQRTQEANTFVVLDLADYQFHPLLNFDSNSFFYVAEFESMDYFVLSMDMLTEAGVVHSYAAYINKEVAWHLEFSEQFENVTVSSKYIFFSSGSLLGGDDTLHLTIVDKLTGQVLLENQKIEGSLTVLDDGYMVSPQRDFTQGITLEDIEDVEEENTLPHEIFDVHGSKLGEFEGRPNLPFYPSVYKGAFISTADLLNEDIQKARGLVRLVNAEGRVVAYTVFISDVVLPLTGAKYDGDYLYTAFNSCTKDGSYLLVQKIGDSIEDYTTAIIDASNFEEIDEYETGMTTEMVLANGIITMDNFDGTSWVLPPQY